MNYKVYITETARNRPADGCENDTIFNHVSEEFTTIEEVKDYLTDRYGKLPSMKRKIYVDLENGGSREIGFLHSFWNKDWSHNTKSWFQTDWVEVTTYKEERILLTA